MNEVNFSIYIPKIVTQVNVIMVESLIGKAFAKARTISSLAESKFHSLW